MCDRTFQKKIRNWTRKNGRQELADVGTEGTRRATKPVAKENCRANQIRRICDIYNCF